MERELRRANDAAPAELQVSPPPFAHPVCGGMNIDTTTQEMLFNMIGRYVICELLIALNTFYIREGILLQVAKNFFLLFDESTNTRVACDLHALKFLTVFPPGERPGVMTQEEKRNYLGQLKANQDCRMQALPAPQEGSGMQGIPVSTRSPSQAANTPAMLYEPYG